ncbi:MAG: hypothetical protein LUI07_08560 [Lachnospiraceae bacterium]|nr:hypothetical protein [Lachnospiraceae bacterium]
MAFQNGIIATGGMIVQFVVNGFGVLFIAGFTATNKLYGMLEIAATSFGYAIVTYIGQNLGAGKIRRIRKGMRAALVTAVATSIVIGSAMLLPTLIGENGIFYAEVLAWLGADVILVSSYLIRMRGLKNYEWSE